jgi:hypothetical protein
VDDGKGGVTTDTVNLTVTDFTAPTLNNVPTGIVAVPAASSSGAQVTFETVTATDAVDGSVPASCAPAGLFPVGDTSVTCSAADSRGNSTSASFTVRVTPPPPPPPPPPSSEEPPREEPPTEPSQPGRAFGLGAVRTQARVYEFSFRAGESVSALESGGLLLGVKSHHPGRKGGTWSEDHFVARTVDRVTFSLNDMTVLFTGRGRWNGQSGYAYSVLAADKKHARHSRGHDWVRVVVKSPAGTIVAMVEGVLTSGSIQITRARR